MNCVNHENAKPVASCVECGSLVCEDCVMEVNGKNYCKKCVSENLIGSKNNQGSDALRHNGKKRNVSLIMVLSVIAFFILTPWTLVSDTLRFMSDMLSYNLGMEYLFKFMFSIIPYILLFVVIIMNMINVNADKKSIIPIYLLIITLVLFILRKINAFIVLSDIGDYDPIRAFFNASTLRYIVAMILTWIATIKSKA